MAVPKRKHSNSRSGMRRSHDKVKAKITSPCPQCGWNTPSHVVCPKCGWYGGRVVNPPKDEE